MDEADALADRVVILVKGEVVCNGSSEFLKQKFGSGFVLTVSLDSAEHVKERATSILQLVQKRVEGARVSGSAAMQFNIVMPFSQKAQYAL